MCIADLATAMDYLAQKNLTARYRFRVRWNEGGGTQTWAARDLRDLRNEQDLRHWRTVQLRLYWARRYVMRMKSQSLPFGRAVQGMTK